jgi:hypothetical protein
MAFDRTNQSDLTALNTEGNTDPIGMGYNVNNPSQLIKIINDPADNVGGETIERVFDVLSLLDALDPKNLGAQQTTIGASDYSQMLITAGRSGINIAPYKSKWSGMFAGNSSTVSALNAQASPLSRAAVLFGNDTVLVKEDWYAARDNG